MFDQMTSDAFAAEALFLRAQYPRSAIVLVEGDSDLRMFQQLLDMDIDRFITCYGRQRALDTIEATINANVLGVLCIVDADFGRLTGLLPNSLHVVVSDFHDFEVMLMNSKSLERLLIEEGSREKIKAQTDNGRTVLEIITTACIPLGCLRLYSQITSAALKFEGLRYRFLGRRLANIQRRDVVKEVFDNTGRYVGLKEANEYINAFDVAAIDVRELVCGHDLSAALGRALQSLVGSRPAIYCAASELEAKLRMGYSREEFAQTAIHAEILAWEQRNPPFTCLH